SDAAVVIPVLDLIAFRDGAMNGPVVKAPATEDAFLACSIRRTTVSRNCTDICRIGVLAPFPDVSRHIVEAKLVWGLLGHLMGVVTASSVVPRHAVDVVAAAEADPVPPMGAAARRVLPLGLGRQPKERGRA